MLTYVIFAIEILVSFLLQSTVFTTLSVSNTVPDLLIIVTVAAGYQNSRLKGMGVGFFCGLLMDATSGGAIGVYALFYMLVGYTCGIFRKYYIQKDWFVPLGLIAISEFAVCSMVYVFGYMIRGDLAFVTYVKGIFLPRILYTVTVSLLYYLLLAFLYERVINRNAVDEAYLAPESILTKENAE
ncbi:MAG: rod shape-determining protein MreD [Lachnospiraceae bacterium]|nr:rod shape-determining protein MreD [Lachnospiraceae bacterium]